MKKKNMKRFKSYILYSLLVVVLFSCSNKRERYIKKETITAEFKVTDVYRAKYSKVKGYINYDGLKVLVDNGNKGYHYTDYNLIKGQTINVTINIYYYSTADGYELVFDDVDVSNYEMN